MSTPTHLADRIQQSDTGPCQLLVLTTPVDGFVSWRGSFLAFPDLAAGEDLLQHLVVSLLDKGTEQRDRFALARVLEDRGASLRLSSDGLYVDVSGQALREDVPVVMEVLAEMLRSPSFTAEEFEKVRSQTLAKLQRQMERTGKQASGALSRRLFPENHPNYSAPPETQIECLKSLSLNDVKTYHERHFGSNDYTLCMVGDVELAEMQEAVASAFDEWPHHRASPTHSTDPAGQEPGHTSIALPDKSNTDVRMGHALPVRRDHDDYIALYVGNYILGGNFSARLMNEIRDERGLTYHIGSGLSGVSTRYAGSWTVEVTLSEDKIAEGIAATRDVIRTFVEEGATGDELEAKKTTITGAYTVGLATTQRLARSLLTNAERDFPAEYLDRFPKEVEALTLEEVNRAIRRYLKPEEMHTALAGTIPKKVEA